MDSAPSLQPSATFSTAATSASSAVSSGLSLPSGMNTVSSLCLGNAPGSAPSSSARAAPLMTSGVFPWPGQPSSLRQEYSLASWEQAPVGSHGGSRALKAHSCVRLCPYRLLCPTDLLRSGSSRAGIGVGARSWLMVKSVLRGRMLPGQDSRQPFCLERSVLFCPCSSLQLR